MDHFAFELSVSAVLVPLTALVHTVGLMLVLRWTRLHVTRLRSPWLAADRVLVPLGMVLGVFLVHGLEVWAWAAVYQALGVTTDLESALYVSAGAYSTAGWSGEHVGVGWRVLVAIEALAGLLLIGWSTAFLFATLHRILTTEETHPLPAGAIAPDDPGA